VLARADESMHFVRGIIRERNPTPNASVAATSASTCPTSSTPAPNSPWS
jgi:hypothetical protein